MREERKEPRPEIPFLLDRDVSKSVSSFSVKPTPTIEQVDLVENATDFLGVCAHRTLSPAALAEQLAEYCFCEILCSVSPIDPRLVCISHRCAAEERYGAPNEGKQLC